MSKKLLSAITLATVIGSTVIPHAAHAAFTISPWAGKASTQSQQSCFREGWGIVTNTNPNNDPGCTGINTSPNGPFSAPFWEVPMPTTATTFTPIFAVHFSTTQTQTITCFAAGMNAEGAVGTFSGNISGASQSIYTLFYANTMNIPTYQFPGLGATMDGYAFGGCYLPVGSSLTNVSY
jgi:hypothetical protein